MDKLKAACENFKAHLAKVVAQELQNPQFRLNLAKGLKGLTNLQMSEFIEFKTIAHKSAITTVDIDRIINAIVRRDPPAEFADNYKNFAIALEKYRAVSDLISKVNDSSAFRKTFDHYQNILLKNRDQQTVDFFKVIKPDFNITYTQDSIFKNPRTAPAMMEAVQAKKFTK
ncbi:MAG: hypothetical protein V4501_09550 [Pseudomonadota bacterium]